MKLEIKKDRWWLIRALLTFALLTIYITCFAQSISTIVKTTDELLNLSQKARAGKKINENELNQAVATAKIRRDALLAEISKNPATVTRFLLPEKIVNSLPKQMHPYLEKEVSNIEGTLEIRAAINSEKEAIQYILITPNHFYHLHFTDSVPADFKTGSKLKLNHGFEIPSNDGSNILLASSQDFVMKHVSELALPNTLGPQKAIAILVNFQDQPNNRPWTIAQVKDILFNQTNKIFLEGSYRQTTIVGDVVGWYVIPLSTTANCSTITNQIPTLAETAAKNAGIDLTPYIRRIYIFPRNNNCSWAALGTIGGNPSKAWMNAYVLDNFISHELGHNLGLYHSNFLKCPGSSTEGNCTNVEYGDGTDLMGDVTLYGHYNAFQKDRLGWLNYLSNPPIQTVTTSGTYTIDPYEHSINVKALKILKKTLADGSRDYYYVEYRQKLGFDTRLGTCTNCDYTKGVVLHLGNDRAGNTSRLIDVTPLDNNPRIVALVPGATYKDVNAAGGGLTITVNSATCENAKVNVKFGGFAPTCVRVSPSLVITPMKTQWVSSGGMASYTLTLTNNDNESCPASRFILSNTHVDGMNESLSANNLKLSPGKSETIKLQILSSKTKSSGIYSVEVNGINSDLPENKASAMANIGIQNN